MTQTKDALPRPVHVEDLVRAVDISYLEDMANWLEEKVAPQAPSGITHMISHVRFVAKIMRQLENEEIYIAQQGQ